MRSRRPGRVLVPWALEGEDVLAGPEDALDALSDRREVEAFSGLVFASGPALSGVSSAFSGRRSSAVT